MSMVLDEKLSSHIKKRNFQINPEIPIIIGTNRNEGEIFVHSAFPAAMPKVSFNMSIICLYFII